MSVVGLTHRTRTAAVAAALGLVLAGGASAVAAAPPPPASGAAGAVLGDARVPLLPGLDGRVTVVRDADALYLLLASPTGEPGMYRRPLTTTADAVTLGAAEYLGRSTFDGGIAVHDGTLAYARAVDGRLVLRAPDGSETVPAWDATTHAFVRGMGDLTADWIVGETIGSWPHLYDLQTGAELDVRSLNPDPGVPSTGSIATIDVSDSRLLWTVQSLQPTGQSVFGVYTVALEPDGPSGPVTTLAQNVCSSPCTGAVVMALDVVGDAVFWEERTTQDVTTVRGLAGPPYAAAPAALPIAGETVGGIAGSELVLARPRADGEQLAWHDLFSATPVEPVRTLTIPGYGTPIDDALVAYVPTGGGVARLADAAGRTVAADPTPAPPVPSFSDVPPAEFTNDAFYGEIMWLADHGVVGGYPDGTFRGLAPVNRDAMAAFLSRLVHDGARPPACATAPFTDVPVSHPFCPEIAWLASTGVTTGWPDGTYRPGTPVSREAMAAFLYRLAHDGADAPACTSTPFVDVAVANPFCGEIAWLASTGVTHGWPDGTFRPAASIERQAMAAFLFRFVDAGLVPTS